MTHLVKHLKLICQVLSLDWTEGFLQAVIGLKSGCVCGMNEGFVSFCEWILRLFHLRGETSPGYSQLLMCILFTLKSSLGLCVLFMLCMSEAGGLKAAACTCSGVLAFTFYPMIRHTDKLLMVNADKDCGVTSCKNWVKASVHDTRTHFPCRKERSEQSSLTPATAWRPLAPPQCAR